MSIFNGHPIKKQKKVKTGSFVNRNAGFSLLEVVVTIGLFCLLLSASLQLWRSVQQHIQYVSAQQEMVENAMGIASHISYEFKLSSKASYEGENTPQGIQTSQIDLERPYWAHGSFLSKKVSLFKESSADDTQGQTFYISKSPGTKYEAGIYLQNIYLQNLENGEYWITLEMKYKSKEYRHAFSAHLME